MLFYYRNDKGDHKDYNGGDDYYKIFIADRQFRYSLLYSVLGFFATALLEPYSNTKKNTRRCLVNIQNHIFSESLWPQLGDHFVTTWWPPWCPPGDHFVTIWGSPHQRWVSHALITGSCLWINLIWFRFTFETMTCWAQLSSRECLSSTGGPWNMKEPLKKEFINAQCLMSW